MAPSSLVLVLGSLRQSAGCEPKAGSVCLSVEPTQDGNADQRWFVGRLIVLGTQLAANLAQAFYLTNQADQLESEAKALYLSVYPASQAPRNMARLWRARLSGTGNENESTVLALIDRLSTTVTQSGISVQNLNFNAARGDLSMQLTGRTSDQIMRLSESMGAMGLQAEIGTISQEGDDVRATVRVKGL